MAKRGRRSRVPRTEVLAETIGHVPDGRVYDGDGEWYRALPDLHVAKVGDFEPLMRAIAECHGWLTYALPAAGLTWQDWARIRKQVSRETLGLIMEAVEAAAQGKADECENVLFNIARGVGKDGAAVAYEASTRVRAAALLLKILDDRKRDPQDGVGGVDRAIADLGAKQRIEMLFAITVNGQAADGATVRVESRDVTPAGAQEQPALSPAPMDEKPKRFVGFT